MRDELQTLFFQQNMYFRTDEKPEDVGSLLTGVILDATKQEPGHCDACTSQDSGLANPHSITMETEVGVRLLCRN